MRLLVVEDEVRMSRLLKRGLEEEGHAVDLAADGPEGWWLATENRYAAIVLDVMLPGFDGCALRACGHRYSCSLHGTRWTTGSAAWTRAPTITWSSRSACWNWPPGCGR